MPPCNEFYQKIILIQLMLAEKQRNLCENQGFLFVCKTTPATITTPSQSQYKTLSNTTEVWRVLIHKMTSFYAKSNIMGTYL